MSTMTLYQFELCPYCHKVKAGLDLKGIPYNKVEVNPISKQELKPLGETPTGRKKVPVLQHQDSVVRDSTEILKWLDQTHPDGVQLLPNNKDELALAETIDTWVNEDLTHILPTVLYGTWGESIKAAKLTAETSNFSRIDNIKVSLFGSVVMKLIAKRILKKRGEGKTGAELLKGELDKLDAWLGDKPFLGGDKPNLGDASTHGALTCVKEFPAFHFIESRPRINAWYQRVADLRQSAGD